MTDGEFHQRDDSDAGAEPREVIFNPSRSDRLLPWLAALSVAGIPYRVRQEEGDWVVCVPIDYADRASAEIDAYERVNRDWPPPPIDIASGSTVSLTVNDFLPPALPALWFRVTGECHPGAEAVVIGACDSVRVAAGETWRLVTALTLHRDLNHLLGNSLCLFFFSLVLSRELGHGLTWFLIVLGGVAANVLGVVTAPYPRSSIGASGAAFAALGLLVTRRLQSNWRVRGEWRSLLDRTWLPVGAGLGTLAFLGANPGTDIVAHASGLVVGMLLAALLPVTGPVCSPWLGRLAGFATAVAVVLAWVLAFHFA